MNTSGVFFFVLCSSSALLASCKSGHDLDTTPTSSAMERFLVLNKVQGSYTVLNRSLDGGSLDVRYPLVIPKPIADKLNAYSINQGGEAIIPFSDLIAINGKYYGKDDISRGLDTRTGTASFSFKQVAATSGVIGIALDEALAFHIPVKNIGFSSERLDFDVAFDDTTVDIGGHAIDGIRGWFADDLTSFSVDISDKTDGAIFSAIDITCSFTIPSQQIRAQFGSVARRLTGGDSSVGTDGFLFVAVDISATGSPDTMQFALISDPAIADSIKADRLLIEDAIINSTEGLDLHFRFTVTDLEISPNS